MTRKEYVDWVKKRAFNVLDSEFGDESKRAIDAFASIVSDLSKNPELVDHPAMLLGTQLQMMGDLKTVEKMRKFISEIS